MVVEAKQDPSQLAKCISCVRREIALRRNVYPRFVQSERMKASTAEYELECMQTVLVILTLAYPAALARVERLEQELEFSRRQADQ